MNKLFYVGRAAAAPEIQDYNGTKVARFRLIRNEYAGRGSDNERKERQVSIPFTAFGAIAEAIVNNVMTGDQLIVEATVRNNNYTDKDNIERFDYNFEIVSFEFGGPGQEKRKKLAN